MILLFIVDYINRELQRQSSFQINLIQNCSGELSSIWIIPSSKTVSRLTKLVPNTFYLFDTQLFSSSYYIYSSYMLSVTILADLCLGTFRISALILYLLLKICILSKMLSASLSTVQSSPFFLSRKDRLSFYSSTWQKIYKTQS